MIDVQNNMKAKKSHILALFPEGIESIYASYDLQPSSISHQVHDSLRKLQKSETIHRGQNTIEHVAYSRYRNIKCLSRHRLMRKIAHTSPYKIKLKYKKRQFTTYTPSITARNSANTCT